MDIFQNNVEDFFLIHDIVFSISLLSYVLYEKTKLSLTCELHLLGLSMGKTAWVFDETAMEWAGDRRLLENNLESIARQVEKIAKFVVQEGFTTQPKWCAFEGISCGTESGTFLYASVVTVSLNNRNLFGTIPTAGSDFRSLSSFDLNENRLHGVIPSNLNKWSPSLTYFNVDNNKLIGNFPDVYSMDLNYTLLDLSFSNNNLNGTLPDSLQHIKTLTSLQLGNNNFTGEIPSVLGLLPLASLSLSSNLFTGKIPIEIFKDLTKLESFSCDLNYLEGTLPTIIGNLLSLKTLNLEFNGFGGTIPSQISKLTNLAYLNLRSNFFSMGTQTILPVETFSNRTIRGFLDLSGNCIEFKSPVVSQDTTATQCPSPTTAPTPCTYFTVMSDYS